MQHILDECRKNLGEAPRKFSLLDRWKYLKIEQPSWCASNNDEMLRFFEQRENMLRNGILTFGCVVQANQLMFTEGKHNCPGEVVYSLEDCTNIAALRRVAHALYDLKGTQPEGEVEACFAEYLTDERIRVYGLRIPESVFAPFACLDSTIFFARHHLPDGKLSLGYFPILVNAQEPRTVMVVPSRYWPQSFQEMWRRGDD